MWIEICENSRPLVIIRMIRVIDMKIFNGDPFRHITGVAEIMLTGIRSADQGGAGWFAARGHEGTVADNEFSLPCAAIVGAQVDKTSAADGGVLHSKRSASDRIDSHVTKRRVADGGICNAHVRIKS